MCHPPVPHADGDSISSSHVSLLVYAGTAAATILVHCAEWAYRQAAATWWIPISTTDESIISPGSLLIAALVGLVCIGVSISPHGCKGQASHWVL